MQYLRGLALCTAALFAANCPGEEYLLRMEHIAPPGIAHFAEGPGAGWVELDHEDFQKVPLVRTIELRVSTTSAFHLQFREKGTVILRGNVVSRAVPRTQVRAVGEAGEPPRPSAAGEQDPDFVVHVHYEFPREGGGTAYMESGLPLRLGKKWYLQGLGGHGMLWSLEEIAAD